MEKNREWLKLVEDLLGENLILKDATRQHYMAESMLLVEALDDLGDRLGQADMKASGHEARVSVLT